MKKLLLILTLCFITISAYSQRISREEYILKYKGIVIEQMEKYGIPASIKMAQAMLESDNGNSRLAIEGNNHFGIKCRGDWTGETITHHDDERDECFRKYANVEESFVDHSLFLDNSPRYNSLFELKENDYKSWAYGLKAAGYATNPKYPEMIIKIIEDNKLYLLDEGVDIKYNDLAKNEVEEKVKAVETVGNKINVDDYTVTINRQTGRKQYYNNGVPYIIAEKGDSFATLAKSLSMSSKKLLKINDFKTMPELAEGDALYIRMKNKHSQNGYMFHVVGQDETMHSISQKYGIRSSSLYKINNMAQGDTVRGGQQIRVR